MRPDRLIDPSQDLDRSVGESLGTRNQRSIVDEIASASKSGKRRKLEIRDDGVIVGDVDIIDFTGSGLAATVLGNVATVNASAGAGGTVEVQEGGVKEDDMSVINFDDSDFNVTNSPAGTANVSLNYNTTANTPAEGNHTHAYSEPLTVTEGGSTVETTVDLINFDATDFNVSNPVNNQVSVTLAYGTSAGTPAEGDHTHALSDMTDVGTLSPSTTGKSLVWDGSEWEDMSIYSSELGPWFKNDVPGTATSPMSLLYFNTATAVSQSTNPIRAGRTGWIVGARIVATNARTAGTATVSVLLNGVDTAFDSGSVALDASRTTQDASIVTASAGIRIASGGDTIGVNLITSGWTPTSGNVTVWLLVTWDPIA